MTEKKRNTRRFRALYPCTDMVTGQPVPQEFDADPLDPRVVRAVELGLYQPCENVQNDEEAE